MIRGARLGVWVVATLATVAGAPLPAGAASPEPVAQRPGPAILYAPLADAPQLQNTGIWRAPPILISGAAAYRGGEYLYQDYLYDDHGARAPGTPADAFADPADRRGSANAGFSQPNGTYTYPSDRAYADNAADLVELRVKPLADATAFRVTLNTMRDPSLSALSIALGGTSGTTHAFPFGANVVAPADYFLTVHPGSRAMVAELDSAAAGTVVPGSMPTVTVDLLRRQIEVRVPHHDWDPTGQAAVRLSAGVGLWDKTAGKYLLPGFANDATHPGGAGSLSNPAAFFNVAFRFHEPHPVYGTGFAQQFATDPAWWRDSDQGTALTAGDLSPLYTTVDFTRLAAGTTDDSGVPRTGAMERILASHFETAQGIDYSNQCNSGSSNCQIEGQYQGRLQPYNLYVPMKAPPSGGYGMTLLLHGNAANYNEFDASHNQAQLGERGPGSIVLTPEDRDPGTETYLGYGAASAFEAWADVAAHYPLDPTWNAISGYSLGGLATYKFSEQFPDLFGRAMAVVGTPGGLVPSTPIPYTGQTAELATLRNIPIMIWDVAADELNPNAAANALDLNQLGYRYDWWEFTGEHFTLGINDEFSPAAAFLGTVRADPNPPHITYVYDAAALDGLARPQADFPQLGFVADHAYWLSGLKLRTNTQGSVDAFSHGFGVGDPPASGIQHGAGTLDGGQLVPSLPYVEQYQTWGPASAAPVADALDLNLTNVRAMTIDVARARVDCEVTLHTASDGPVAITLAGCGRTVSFGSTVSGAMPNTAGPGRALSPGTLLLVIAGLAGFASGWRGRRRQGSRRASVSSEA